MKCKVLDNRAITDATAVRIGTASEPQDYLRNIDYGDLEWRI